MEAGRLPRTRTAEAGCQGKGLKSSVLSEKPGLDSRSVSLSPPAFSLLGAHPPPTAGCHSLSTYLHLFLLSSVCQEEPNSWLETGLSPTYAPGPPLSRPVGGVEARLHPSLTGSLEPSPALPSARRHTALAPRFPGLGACVLTSYPVDLSKPF